MGINRRAFLILFATGGAAVVGSILIFRRSGSSDLWLLPLLQSGQKPAGRLSETTLTILIAMTEALTGRRDLQGDYANYFQWRSENLARYKDRYERFAEILQRKSMEMTKRNFCDHALDVRLNIVNSLRPTLQKERKKEPLKQSEKDLLEFERYIIQETLRLFARTDALLALGYESFPGQARGFEAYKKLPA